MRSTLQHLSKLIVKYVLKKSILASNKERGERSIYEMLPSIVPNITKHFSSVEIDESDSFLNDHIRCQHAFQIKLVLKAIDRLAPKIDSHINIVDIGDSSGTHLTYINALLRNKRLKVSTLSVNLDPIAVDKIKAKGLNALRCRAEELHMIEGGMEADIFLSFEMLEHLVDPITFLHALATHGKCKYFILTVPYLKKSRIGLHQLRRETKGEMNAENTHIFELCPDDWNLLFTFCGWERIHADIFTLYPKRSILNMSKYIWRALSFEGYYGVILKQNTTVSQLYKAWRSFL